MRWRFWRSLSSFCVVGRRGQPGEKGAVGWAGSAFYKWDTMIWVIWDHYNHGHRGNPKCTACRPVTRSWLIWKEKVKIMFAIARSNNNQKYSAPSPDGITRDWKILKPPTKENENSPKPMHSFKFCPNWSSAPSNPPPQAPFKGILIECSFFRSLSLDTGTCR